jgi:hypothetical protein
MDSSSGLSWSEGLVQGLIGYGLTIAVAMAAAGLIWLIVYTLEALHKKGRAAAAPTAVKVAVAPEPEKVDETARHVAAVAAAVYATLGAARLVYVGEGAHSPAWTSTGRTIHQTSHMPKRAPKR